MNENNAKYLLLASQITVANADINKSRECLQRLRNRLAQIDLMKSFLATASPLAESTSDGLKLNSKLLEIEGQLRNDLIVDNFNSLDFWINFALSYCKLTLNSQKDWMPIFRSLLAARREG